MGLLNEPVHRKRSTQADFNPHWSHMRSCTFLCAQAEIWYHNRIMHMSRHDWVFSAGIWLFVTHHIRENGYSWHFFHLFIYQGDNFWNSLFAFLLMILSKKGFTFTAKLFGPQERLFPLRVDANDKWDMHDFERGVLPWMCIHSL